jgi:maleate isomerase
MRPGSLEDFIRLLPDGVGVIPLFLNISEGSETEFRAVLSACEAKVAELAAVGVDLIHPEGAPPFMVQGYAGEEKITREWEQRFGVPVITAPQSQVEALRTMDIQRFVGVTYFAGAINDIFSSYFRDAGFEVLGMEGIDVPFNDVQRLSSQEVYAHTKRAYLKHEAADGIYMLGSGWRLLDIVETLEQDLGVPVIHPIPARVWAVQKRLHIRQPVPGYGLLLETLP